MAIHRDRTRRTRAAALGVLAVTVGFGRAAGQSAFVGPPLPDEREPTHRVDAVAVPRGEEDIRRFREKLAGDIEVNQRTLERLNREGKDKEPSAADKAYTAALGALVDIQRVYETQLHEYAEVLEHIRGLEDPASAARLADELAGLQRAIDEVQQDAARRSEGVTAEEFERAEGELEAVKANLAAQVKLQEERGQRRAELPARLEALKSEAAGVQDALNRSAGEFESIKTRLPPESKEYLTAELTVDRLKYEAGLFGLRMARLEQEVRRGGLRGAQTEQRLPLLRQLVTEHEKRVERYKQLRATSEIRTAKEELERAKTQAEQVSPLELAYLDMQVRVRERLQELDRMARDLGLRDRYGEANLATLREDIEEDVREWSRYMEVLDRKSGDQIKSYYRRLGSLQRSRAAERDRVLLLYDNTLDDRVRITDRIDQAVDEELRAGWRHLQELERAESGSEVFVRLKPEITKLQEGFEKEIVGLRGGLDALVERLAEAGRLLTEHVDYLAAQRSRMYWSYLRVQEQPLWKLRASEMRSEWLAEAGRRAALTERLRKGVEEIPSRTAVTVSVVLVVLLGASWVARRRLLIYADGLEQQVGATLTDSEETVAAVSDRFHLQLIRFLGRTAPVVVPAAAAWVWIVGFSPLDGRLMGTIMGMLVAAGAANGLISTLFSRSKPRFRLVPCSHVVAGHYRRALRALLYLSVVAVPAPLLLTVFDLAPYTRYHLWSVYKVAALAIVLLFLLPRQTVLRVAGRAQDARHPLLYLLISTLYPLAVFGVVILILLQVVGFGPLVTYLVSGVAQSLAVAVLAMLVVRYLRDMARRVGQKLASVKEESAGDEGLPEELAAGREVTLTDRAASSLDEQLWLGILLSLFRGAVALGAVALVLGAWGVSRVDMRRAMALALIPAAENRPAITVGRALAALAVLLLVWLFSRAVRAFLDSRVFPTYASLDRGGRVAINTLLHYTLVFLGFYFSLYVVQIPLGALTVVLGTLGLGLGLGLQPVFVNFLSGIIILFERHVKVGDLIEINGVLGEVSGISLRATTVKTYDNVDMVIPNADFVSGSVINWTMNDPRIRGKVEVGVAYDSDVRLVERLLLQVARESKLTLKEPPPRVRFTQFGESALNFVLFAWFYNAADRWDFMTDSRYRIVELFREHGVEIPFPQRTLGLLKDMPLRVRVESASREGDGPRRDKEVRGEGSTSSSETPAGRR